MLVAGAEFVEPADLAALDASRFAVRSSATFEDRPGAGAAGLLRTVLDVDVDGVAMAIAACRASADADHVVAYLRHRGLESESLAVAVIIQAMVGPGRRGTLASRDPGGTGLARIEEEAHGGPRVTLLSREELPEPLLSALALEADLGGPIEIEWAESQGKTFVLQARPSPPIVLADPFPVDFRTTEDRCRRWRWDREHNPEPLSPAHEGLVAMVDRATPAGRLRVWHGYLYVGERMDSASGGEPADGACGWYDQVVMEQCQTMAKAEPGQRLQRALNAFVDFAGRYAAASSAMRRAGPGPAGHGPSPAVRRDLELWNLARAAAQAPGLVDYLRDPSHPAPPSIEMADWFSALRAHLDRWGAFAPVWDVAVPTYGEDPRPLYPVLLRMAADEVSPVDRRAAAGGGPGARADGEEDDVVFARALRVVRRALLAVGREWVGKGRLDEPGDVFFLPLDTVRAGAAPSDAREIAHAAREQLAARARIVPPLAILGDERHWARPAGDVLTGAGVGGRARGRAVVIRDAAHLVAPPAGAVLVVPTVSPTMTFLLATAAAVVTDHGGLLDHGAFMAREYGLPAVVGTFWATRVLRDGDEVVVDGPAGKVYALGSGRGG